jgi:hypothetical protein
MRNISLREPRGELGERTRRERLDKLWLYMRKRVARRINLERGLDVEDESVAIK